MRILMLGWEFPPFISGGLGTACYGLTKALDRLGHQVIFVLPRPVDRSQASHIVLLSPDSAYAVASGTAGSASVKRTGKSRHRSGIGGPGGGSAGGESVSDTFADREGSNTGDSFSMDEFEHVRFRSVPSTFSSPYPDFHGSSQRAQTAASGSHDAAELDPDGAAHDALEAAGLLTGTQGQPSTGTGSFSGGTSPGASAPPSAASPFGGTGGGAGIAYQGDMHENAERYARLVVALSRREKFDVIHAHDWMTYPAGQAVAQLSGKPLVVHVHSTEFDRAGDIPNQRVYDIERRGMHAALRVIAVSNLTASICTSRYGIDPAKIDVVWNGIDSEAAQPKPDHPGISAKDKIVLFLGRITMQKGPEYFIRSAARVLEKVPNAKFVVAGSGDMATRMIEEAAALGIGHKVTFTGFLRGKDVDRVFQMADCYVMPSVSEPFGIAPLEAMRNDVPVIISKQSGVSEALTHALKVDFWDIDEMANKIVAVLRHPPLGATLREHGAFELRKLTWEGAAIKCVEAYQKAAKAQGR